MDRSKVNSLSSKERVRAFRKRIRDLRDATANELVETTDPIATAERSRAYRARRRLSQHVVTAEVVGESDSETECNIEVERSPFGTDVKNRMIATAEQMPEVNDYVRLMVTMFFDDTLEDYCRVCDRIWWTSRLRKLSTIKKECVGTVLKHAGYKIDEPDFKLCATCLSALNQNRLPTMATVNGYTYPPIPQQLPTLTPIEIRLISPRLPFMQIRHIRYFQGAKRIVGQVINVPINVMKTVNCLPRRLDDDATFNVCLKRHLLNRGSYMTGCISKRNIKIWLKYLVNTPLYRANNITINECFINNISDDEDSEEENQERQADWERRDTVNKQKFTTISTRDEEMMNDEEFMALQQHTLFWGEDMILHMAPGMHEKPYALSFDEDAEELSFPEIYFGEPRRYKVHTTHFAKATSEIRRRDRRGVQSDKILYTAAKIMRIRIINSFNVMFKTRSSQGTQITREDISNPEFVREIMDRNESFLKEIPNSVQYWNGRKRDLFAMMRQLGKPTLFLTLSASEIHWPHLLRCVYQFQHRDGDSMELDLSNDDFINMSASVRAELINNDPVLCCLYFEKFVKNILETLKKATGPFGRHRVIDYFMRYEFQHRGSPHCHTLLWIDNAPTQEDIDAMTDVGSIVDVIDRLATVDSALLCSTRELQTHHHTHTCYKKSNRSCRFGAPFWPMDRTRILTPVEIIERNEATIELFKAMHRNLETVGYETLEDFLGVHLVDSVDVYVNILRHGITRPTVFMKRDIKDIWTSPFNPSISAVLQSNMDVQFILDAYSCAAYVAEYVNKSERGFSSLHRELVRVRDEYPEMDYETCMKTLGKQVLNTVEMCAQEAAWFLLRLPMSMMSRSVEFIPTQHPSQRALVRKTKSQMDREVLAGTSTDIWQTNLIQRYERRPVEYDNVHLADFIANFEQVRKRLPRSIAVEDNHAGEEQGYDDNIHDDIEGHDIGNEDTDDPLHEEQNNDVAGMEGQGPVWRKRSSGRKIIKWVNYKQAVDELNYMREMVTLFWPFRNEELDLLNNDSYIALYTANVELLLSQRLVYDKGLSVDKIMALVAQINERAAAIERTPNGCENENVELPGPLVTNVPDNNFLSEPVRAVNDDDLNTLHRNTIVRPVQRVMTHKQYCNTMQSLNDGQKTFVLEFIHRLLYAKEKPLQVFFTGPAGAGKTTTLNILMETCNRFTQRHNVARNAFVACATTGKAAVHINGTTVHTAMNITIDPKKRSLGGEAKQTMRCDLSEVVLILIDEVSMASSNILNCVYERLCSIGKDPTKSFGGFHVVFCGDLRQLPPVNARAVYVRPANILQDRMIWQSLEYYPLTQVMRQADVKFSSILTKIGSGDVLKPGERRLIESRFIDLDTAVNDPRLRSATRLFFQNKDVDDFNYKMLASMPERVIVDAADVIVGDATPIQAANVTAKVRQLNVAKTGNMVRSLILVPGQSYIVTQNIDKPDGIVNGACGLLRYIERETGSNTVVRVWIEFDRATTGALMRLKYAHHARALSLSSKLTPLLRRSAIISVGSRLIRVRRTQFPIIPGGAMTIHKAQGGTYELIVYMYDRSHDIALVYVAMSRAQRLEGLYLVNAKNDHKFYHCQSANSRVQLSTEFARLETCSMSSVVVDCKQFISESNNQNVSPVAYLNCQSLAAHAIDITADPVLRDSSLLALSETWMSDTRPPVEVVGFECVSRYKRPMVRAGGVAIYKSIKCYKTKCTYTNLNMVGCNHGDATAARVARLDENGREIFSFHLVTIYAKTGITERQLMQLFSHALACFNKRSHDFDFEVCNSPLLICGDLNFELSSEKGARIESFLREIHDVRLATNLGVSTRNGTCIDSLLYKTKCIETIPYISYFSTHRPFLTRISNVNCNPNHYARPLGQWKRGQDGQSSCADTGRMYIGRNTTPETYTFQGASYRHFEKDDNDSDNDQCAIDDCLDGALTATEEEARVESIWRSGYIGCL